MDRERVPRKLHELRIFHHVAVHGVFQAYALDGQGLTAREHSTRHSAQQHLPRPRQDCREALRRPVRRVEAREAVLNLQRRPLLGNIIQRQSFLMEQHQEVSLSVRKPACCLELRNARGQLARWHDVVLATVNPMIGLPLDAFRRLRWAFCGNYLQVMLEETTMIAKQAPLEGNDGPHGHLLHALLKAILPARGRESRQPAREPKPHPGLAHAEILARSDSVCSLVAGFPQRLAQRLTLNA